MSPRDTDEAVRQDRPPAIHCRDLVRIFRAEEVEVQALQGVDLDVRAGEQVAVVGVSGSGKSTLLSILAGLDVPTAGQATVAGHDLLRLTPAERVRYQRDVVGFVWQRPSRNLLPYLSAAENVALVLAIHRSPRATRAARAPELLDLLGVAHLADRLPVVLSGGEQQRVAIAVALAGDPAVVLADEPTGELDEEATAEVLGALRRINEEAGVTTLVVTHDPAVAAHVRRTIAMRDGRITTETMRRRSPGADGEEHEEVAEFAVMDRLGRMQVPLETRIALGLGRRVRLDERPEHLAVWPQGQGWVEQDGAEAPEEQS